MSERTIQGTGHLMGTEFWRDVVTGNTSFLHSRQRGLLWSRRIVRVLLAHSDGKFRKALTAGLVPLGFVVEEVADGPALLERMGNTLLEDEDGEATRPDLIIADLGLKGFDGLNTLVTLRMCGIHLPWIFTARNAKAADYEIVKGFQRVVLVELPMDWDDFLTVISLLLDLTYRPQPSIPYRMTGRKSRFAASA